jgi:cyclase
MLKKRLIFTLLFNNGSFMLSRNFRLQSIGDLDWLQRNYVFTNISAAIDEIVVLNVSRGEPDGERFRDALRHLTESCFIPISAGGWVRTVEDARLLLRSGADKVVVNTPLALDRGLVSDLAAEFGTQCVVASVDLAKSPDAGWQVRVEGGQRTVPGPAHEWLSSLADQPIGDLYLNSIDRDGTGQGYHLEMLDQLPKGFAVPVIMAGGAGNSTHLEAGLRDSRVDAVATAHLLNFVGDGLIKARRNLIDSGIPLPVRSVDIRDLRAT